MNYSRFEDLPVWQASADLAADMLQWTTQAWFRGKGDLANQIQRAALSISNNIAEGFERGTTNELLQFLYIARGSAGEVRSMLAVIERMTSESTESQLRSDVLRFKSQCEGISRQLRGWANSLQNSDIKGQRHLNDQTRAEFDQRQRQTAFQKHLDSLSEQARQKRETQRREQLSQADEGQDGAESHGA